MRRIIPLAIAAAVLVAGGGYSALAMNNNEHMKHDSHKKNASRASDQVLCGELAAMDQEYIGSMLYYVKGHYDSERNVWTDYGPNNNEGTLMVENMYLPVPEIITYCAEYPENTVVQAIEETGKNKNHRDQSHEGSQNHNGGQMQE